MQTGGRAKGYALERSPQTISARLKRSLGERYGTAVAIAGGVVMLEYIVTGLCFCRSTSLVKGRSIDVAIDGAQQA